MTYNQRRVSINKVNDPTAFITVGKQRIKQNKGTVYLENNQNFELELFNPTQNDLLAKIEIDGKLISNSGIVLRPGERVFLDRYLDTNNKFLFKTYQVGNSDEVKKAIDNNGKLKISFYSEYIQPTYLNSYWYHPYNITYGSGMTEVSTFTNSSSNTATLDFMPNENSTTHRPSPSTRKLSRKTIETGKTEKGEASSQSFTYIDKQFNSWTTHTVEWKILPKSQKPATAEDIRVKYCTGCGTKMKKTSWKFCPSCGTKY